MNFEKKSSHRDIKVYNEKNRISLLNISYLIEQLSIHGYIKIENFKNLEDFKKFTDLTGLHFRGYYGAGIIRESSLNDHTLLNVNMPDDFGGSTLHGEQYYLTNPPGIIFFYCNKKAEKGGETLLCKGTELLIRLPDILQYKFIEQNILIKRIFPAEQWNSTIGEKSEVAKGWKCQTGSDGRVYIKFETKGIWKAPNGMNAFINSILPMLFDFEKEDQKMEVLFEDGTVIDRTIGKKILDVAKNVQQKILLQENQGLIVDNRWVMHGRTAFSGERQMFTRMSLASIKLENL